MMFVAKIFGSIVLFATVVICQENAGSNVAEPLLYCYNTTIYRNRDSRLPSTMNVLIDLIRRAEDGKSNLDMRILSYQLIHKFRQDGIIYKPLANKDLVPYTPKGFQVYKNRLMMKKLLPGNALTFPNDTLNDMQTCSMHYMLSNTFEMAERLDESITCGVVGAYTRRLRRSSDVEEATDENPDAETVPRSSSSQNSDGISECPIESGVVFSKYGAIQAGTLIAGIAAGLEEQRVKISNDVVCSSIYGLTLAGDIAEVATLQGPRESFQMGPKGSWNSTLAPKYYFIQERDNNKMTNAEIRAGLDGLIIAKNIQSWKQSFPRLKISQILDMYYSQKGVMQSKNIKACKRYELRAEYAPEETLKSEAFAFAKLYDEYAEFDATMNDENFRKFTAKAVDSYLTYDVNMNDLTCESDENVERIETEIYIILDTKWTYEHIAPVISYLLDNLEINKFASNVTLISANDGSVIVNSTNSIAFFHENYDVTSHETIASGTFNPSKALSVLDDLLRDRITFETRFKYITAGSQIVLFVPEDSTIPDSEIRAVNRIKSEIYTKYYPDFRFMVLGTGSKDAYSELVSSNDDVFSLQYNSDSNVISSVKPLVRKISEVPRRLKNPSCDARMKGDNGGTTEEINLERGTTNFFRMSPNYFYGDGKHSIKVRSSSIPLMVCTSRSNPRPSEGDKAGDTTCEQVTNGDKVFELNDACTDSVGSCSPFYLSIKVQDSTSTSNQCIDCRFPDNVKVMISTENLSCKRGNNAVASIANIFLIVSLAVFINFV